MKITPDSKDYKLRLMDRMADGSGLSVFGFTYDSPRLQSILERNGGQLTVSVHVDLADHTSILVGLPDGSLLLLKAHNPRGQATNFHDRMADLRASARGVHPSHRRGHGSGLQLVPLREKKDRTSD